MGLTVLEIVFWKSVEDAKSERLAFRAQTQIFLHKYS